MTAHPRYELLEKVASGSFATVYRGRDLELGREVAIKQIHEQYLQDPQQLDRYWHEAQLLASLQHPNIVTIFDVVRDRGWLILELMQSDLSRVAGRKQMDLNSLRTTVAHCLRALKFLHAHGIVHGDIKPSNMMIDRRRRVKIGDFGLARRVSDEGGSLIKGTTKYMAPEVVSDEFGDVGPASDLYSLGFAAYELMCGENFESLFPGLNAFGRDRQMAWMMWHAAPDRRLPEISRVLENVPPDLAKTIQKLVAKPQSERYRTADQALADLNVDIKSARPGEESLEGLGKTIAGTVPGAGVDQRRRWLVIGAFAVSVIMSLVVAFFPTGEKPSQSTAPGDGTKPLTGIVREVLVDEGKIVIEDEHGVPEEIDVGKQPRIRVDEGDYVLLRELQKQDRVEIRRPTGDGRIQITALRPARGHGKIREIDPENQKLTASIAADPHPQEVPMYVPKGSRLFLNGKSVTIADLLPGDEIEVIHIKDTAGRAPRDVIRLESKRSQSLTGFLKEIKTTDSARWLIVDRHGAEIPLELGETLKVIINGAGDNGSRAFTTQDLQPGDRLIVTHDTHVTAIEAERRGRLTGVLLRIDPAGHEMIVRGNDGKEVTCRVEESSRIFLDDRPATFEDLRKFDMLDLTYDEGSDGLLPARTIDARRPKT